MFERFSEQSIRVIMYAQDESRKLGHHTVGTEHLLLGLLRVGPGIAARILVDFGVVPSSAREEVKKVLPRADGFSIQEMPFDQDCKRVLERSWDESRRFGHNYVGTHHLLLGLVRDKDEISTCSAVRILESLGVDIALLISKVEEKIASESTSKAANRYSRFGLAASLRAEADKKNDLPWSAKTHYQILQVDPRAETGLISEVYRFLSEKYHPDREKTGDKERYDLIENAWMVLSDETRRREYDATLNSSNTEES